MSACCGTHKKTQAGAESSASTGSCIAMTCAHVPAGAPHDRPMRDDCKLGRGRTANGMRRAMSSQRRQCGSSVRMSAPISQTKRARGNSPKQAAQRVDGVAGAEHDLDRAGHHATSVGDAARGCQALAERRHAALRLQRIAGRNQQPHLVQPQPPPRDFNDVAMTFMRRIERAAEQADAHAATVAEPRDQLVSVRRVQGRTCPLPITR